MAKILGTIILVLFILSIFGAFAYIIALFEWMPTSKKLRIAKREEGIYTFYQAQFNRPIFGWTGFGASKYTGEKWITSR